MDFGPKMVPKWIPKQLDALSLLASKICVFPHGSFWGVPWSLWLPFWCILVALGYHFWIILVILDQFGSHFGPFCTSLAPMLLQNRVLGDLGKFFGHNFGIILVILDPFHVKTTLFGTLFRRIAAECRWHLRRRSFSSELTPLPPGPERNFAVGNLDK